MENPEDKKAAPHVSFLLHKLAEIIENRAKLYEAERERFKNLEFKDGEKIKIVRPKSY